MPTRTKVNSFKSALLVAHSLAQLQRELHSQWDDSDWSEREAHGSKAQEYGRAWGLAARGHVNNSINYYYVHFSIYHLKEVIVTNGHPLLGDDSIQEISNKEMKSFKDLVFHCPYSRDKVKVVKHMKVFGEEEEEEAEGESEYEEHVSYRKPQLPVPAQVQRLKKLKEHVNRQRGYRGKRQKQSKGVQKSLKVKKESARLLREGVVAELARERAKL